MNSMSTKQQGRPIGAVPLTLHVQNNMCNSIHKPFLVIKPNYSTIKMIQIRKSSIETKFEQLPTIGITFA